MAKAMLFYNPRPQYWINGALASGAKLFFYTVGTSTKKNTYTDATKVTANPNPIILDSQGRPANGGTAIDIFLDGAYRVVLAPSTDTDPPTNAVWDRPSVTTISQLESTAAKSTNYTVLETDRDKTFLVDASGGTVTLSLLAAATAGDGFTITIKKTDSSSNAVVIDGNSSELIDAATTYSISIPYGVVKIICNGIGWYVQYQGVNANAVTFEDSRTNTLVSPFTVTATTSGTPAAGIGTGITYKAESADENPSDFGAAGFSASDVSSGSEDTYFTLFLRKAGAALAEAFRFACTGASYFLFTGAPTAVRTITIPDSDVNLAGVLPIGAMLSWGTTSAPTYWKLMDGSAISRTTYSALFAVIGTTFGAGDGSTTFNVPDIRGRCWIGTGTGTGLTARTLAATGGEQTHTLLEAELPSHDHDISSFPANVAAYGAGGSTAAVSSGATVQTGATGGGTAFNVMQPYLVLTGIIYAGV
jgi:microcystin-dependent protein